MKTAVLHTVIRTLVGVTILMGSDVASGQAHRASVRGHVTDRSGAPLPNAEVGATSDDTNESRRATTDEGGRFAIPELAVGACRIEVALSGYRTFTSRAELVVGQDLWLDVALEVTIAQGVEVRAPFVPIDRDSAAMATFIDQRQGGGLPLHGPHFLGV